MGVMEKMRNSTASILWILIFSFGVLWVLADVDFFSGITQGPTSLGVVNGDEISLDEYNQRVSFYTEQFNQQTGSTMTPEMRALYENQAWEDLVAARLIQQKMNELGISVTDSELMDMVTGENPDPFIRQQFQREDGTIDRIALRAAIEAPENSEVWIMIEQQLRENRRQQKMNNFISSGLRVSSLDIKHEFIRNNSFAELRYVRFPYSEISDDEISVSEEEMREFHGNNPDRFQRSESYRFRYVSWDKTPTQRDTLSTVQEIEDLKGAFANAVNDSVFVRRYQSATPFRGGYVNIDDIREEYRPVIDLEVGEVSELIMINGDPHVFKKIDQRGNEIKFAVLSYRVIADPIATIDRLSEEAEEFRFYARSDGFVEEAERNDFRIREASATKDNPFIPGLGQSQILLNSIEALRTNRISEPIELDDQFVVVQMIERIPEGLRPLSEVRSQVETAVRNEKRKELMYSRVQEMLNDMSDISELAALAGKEVRNADGVRMSGSSLPGAGRELEVIGAAFSLNENEMSGAIRGENAVFVILVDELDMADASQMSVAQQSEIRRNLEQQKFMAFNQVFVDRLKEDARITDNRSRILR
jgi:peptidyl-prolyl cis-trans isomerase D